MRLELNCLTIAVVTKPFQFEGKQRMRNAEAGINELKQYVDTLVVIPNDRRCRWSARGRPCWKLSVADDVLRQGIQGISDLIALPATINLDFADEDSHGIGRMAHIGIGTGKGDNRMVHGEERRGKPAAGDRDRRRRAVLINVTGGEDIH